MYILVRYGEIGVKSDQVRRDFEERLMERLREKLAYREIDGAVERTEGRVFADVDEDAAADAAVALARVPGVVSASPVEVASLDLDDIAAAAVRMLEGNDADTFAVDARRAGDHEYTSKDVEEHVGSAVEDAYDLAVDLDEPDVTVGVEARYRQAYLSTARVDGVGGLPVDREARVAVLLEDRTSTVAAFLLMKRGCSVYPVYPGGEGEDVEHEVGLLREYDPAVKLTVRDEPGEAALATVCDLYDCHAAAVSATTDEIDRETAGLDVEVLHPTAGMTEEAVLERYSRMQTPPTL